MLYQNDRQKYLEKFLFLDRFLTVRMNMLYKVVFYILLLKFTCIFN